MEKLLTKLIMTQDDNMKIQIAKELAEYGKDGVELILDNLMSERNIRVFLKTLLRMISNLQCRNYLINKWKRLHFSPLIKYSEDKDAKVRKTAYIIMGKMQDKSIMEKLITALENEKILYNIPSIILALGNYNDEKLINLLNEESNKIIENNNSLSNEKHITEIKRALNLAIDNLAKEQEKHKFIKLDKIYPIILTTMSNHFNITFNEAKELFHDVKINDDGIEILTDDLIQIYKLRTFYETLISPVNLRNISYNPKSIVKILKSQISINNLNLWHSGKPPYKYRIELKGAFIDRKNDISAFIREIDKCYQGQLINSISDYELEFRIIKEKDTCSLYIKLYTFYDKRFNYRINKLPASIKGVNAAICMKLVSKYFKDNIKVLDPFVGTGTMLIERAFYNKNIKFTGIDIYSNAIKFAKENIKAAKLYAKLIKSDIVKLEINDKFDEIISNMPYGIRVGNHEANEELYKNFINLLPKIMEVNGIAILLTTDYKLLKHYAKMNNLRLVDEFIISSGGLYPHLLVYKLT